ncbi:MAG: hypothetical protein L6R28_22645 [Planctomycetes bacterium]|nr:hypothetical protein [Planctomycetota bacterium]
MKPTMRKTLQKRPVLCLLAILAATPRVHAEAGSLEDIDLEKRIGWTIYDTFHRESTKQPPPQATIQTYRDRGKSQEKLGVTYAYWEDFQSPEDKQPIRLYAEVVQLPPDWKEDAEAAAAWKERAKPSDPGTNGEVYVQKKTVGQVHRTRVYFRLVSGSLMLKMWEHRNSEAAHTDEELVAKALPWWKSFHKNAVEKGLLVSTRIVVEARPSEANKQGPLSEDEVVSILANRDKTAEIPLRISAAGPDIRSDKPYKLQVLVSERLGQAGGKLLYADGTPLADEDGDGRLDLAVARGDTPAEVVARFDPFVAENGATARKGALHQVLQVRIKIVDRDNKAKAQQDIAVQRRDWTPVVTRFELIGRDWTPKYPPADPDSKVPSDLQNRFNEYNDPKGYLLKHIWETQIAPMASSKDTYGPQEPVVLGWRVDEQKPEVFYLALNAPEKRALFGVPEKSPQYVVADVKIVSETVATDIDFDAEDFGSGPADGGVRLDNPEFDFYKRIQVDDLALTMRRLAVQGVGAPEADTQKAQAEKRLAEQLRKDGTELADADKIETVLERWQTGRSSLNDYFPFTERGKPPAERTRGEDQRLARLSGIYALRLKMELSYAGVAATAKKIDVSIRYNVVGQTFKTQILQYEQGRLK